MKRRVLGMLLALCLLAGIMSTAALADDTQTGTIVYRQDDGTGHIYTGSGFISFDSAASAEASVFQVGQSVSFAMTEGAITDGSLCVTSSTPMSLSLSGGGRVGESLGINAGSVPQIGTVSIQMYQAELLDEVFNNPDGEASVYDAAGFTVLTHTVTEESTGKYVGVQLSYSVNVDGTDCSCVLRATTEQAVAADISTDTDDGDDSDTDITEDIGDEDFSEDKTEDAGDGDDSDADIITHVDDNRREYAGILCVRVNVGEEPHEFADWPFAFDFANSVTGSEIVTVTALYHGTLSESIELNRAALIVLDLNGYKLDFGSNSLMISDGNLNVVDSSEGSGGKMTSAAAEFVKASGTFKLISGNIECTGGTALCFAPETVADITVFGGSITGRDAAVRLEAYESGGSLNISGGSFTATDAAGTALLTGVNTSLTGGTFINTEGGTTIEDISAVDDFPVANYLESGYCYYSTDGTGAVLVDGEGTYIAQSVTVSQQRVSTLDLTALIAAPAVGATPQTTFADQPDFTVSTVEWTPTSATGKFELGGLYTAKLSITPTEGRILEGISETAGFSHTGASSVTLSNTDGQYNVTIVFPAVTAPTFVTATALTGAGVSGPFQINGTPFDTSTIGSGVELGTTASSFATTYTSSGGANPYPTGMQVFAMKSSDNGFGVTPQPKLANALQYMGSSVRTSGVKGVRMITGITQELRAKLLRAELDGYKLMEYGTLVAFQTDMVKDSLTLDDSYAKHNYAYKRGVSDAVFDNANGLTQFTNVLTNFTLEQCKKTLGMRPYMILENKDGETMILYGGIVYRSIGYIAWQNRDTYEPGTAEYRYIHEIIDYVYGANTPTD